MSLASSPSRIKRSNEGWKAIELVVDYTHAVGRVGDKGSCILISLPVPANSVHNGHVNNYGIVLTTSFVIQNREEAKDVRVTFLEQPVTGSCAKGAIKPVTVNLRGDSILFCSARAPPKRHVDYFVDDQVDAAEDADDVQHVEELGYTIMACDLRSVDDARLDLRAITPLPLPLILSTIPPVHVGDTHLLVTHENSKSRRYVVATVTEVHDHHCAYHHADPTCQFSSGGSVFSSRGEFIGVQHQCGDSSYCIFIRDVVSHLFESGMLGLCKIPLLSADSEDARDEEGELNANAVITDGEFNEPFNLLQRTKLIDVGAGDQIINFEELQIVQRRKDSGAIKGETVRIRRHAEVWDYWTSVSGSPGSANYYRALILLLSAFPYQSKLCVKILSELTSHDNRHHIASVASHGGVGIMLEVLDSHPHDQTLVQTAVTSLARVSLYDGNKESIARSDGVPVILAVMREFMMVYDIQQWSFYLLLNLLDGQFAEDCAKSIMAYAGLEVMVHSLQRHATGPHLQRWGWQCVGLVARRMASAPTATTMMILGGLGGLQLLVQRLETFWTNGYVCFGIAYALHSLLRVDDTNAAVTGAAAMDALEALIAMQLPLHEHNDVRRPEGEEAEDDPDVEASLADQRQMLAHEKHGCCTEPTFFGLIFQLLRYHSTHLCNDSAPLVEYLLVCYLDALQLQPNSDFSPIDIREQEVLVADVTLAFMTEARMHTIADKVMRFLGVADPFAKYSHFMRDRNANAHKEL